MKPKKKRYVIIILLVCIIFLIIHFTRYTFLQEDLLFFQFLNSRSQSEDISQKEKKIMEENIQKTDVNTHIEKLYFDVQYKNSKIKALNLTDTVDNQTLVYEKIAPGTSGKFDIVLHSNQNMNYQIAFKSENEKPSNLQFYTLENEKKFDTLEELGENLMGKILENEEKIIPVYWKWGYEANAQQNIQDTLDAKNMREYHFLIYVQGY